MGLIQVPGRRIRANFKPDFPVEINQDHPLASSLVFASHVTQGELVGNLPENIYANSVLTTGPQGRVVSGAGNGNGYANYAIGMSHPLRSLNNTATFVFIANLEAVLVTNGAGIVTGPQFYANDTSPYVAFAILQGNSYANALQLFWAISTSSFNGAAIMSGVIATGWHVYAITFTFLGSSNVISFYRDGLLIGTSTQTSNVGPITFGTYNAPAILSVGSVAAVSQSQLSNVYIFNKVLSTAEIQSLNWNPYQLLRAKQRDIWLTVGGGGSTPQTAVVLGASIQLSLASAQVVANNALSGSNTESTSSGASVVPQFTTITTNGQNAATGNASVLASSNVQSNSTQVSEAAAPISSDTPIYGNAEQSEVSAASIVSAAINVTTASAQAIVSDGALNATVTISGQAIQQALMSAGISSSDIVYGDGTQSAGSSGSITTGVAATSPVYANGFEDSASSGSVSATLEMTGDAKQTEVSKVVITTTTMLTSFGLTKATVNSTISANTVFDANGNQIQASTGDVLGETPVDCHSIQISISRGVLTTVSTFNGAAIQSALSGANVTFALPSIPIFPNKKFGMSGAFSSRMPALPMSVVARNIVSSLTTRVLT